MGEFDIIERLFAPLTDEHPDALQLKDDVALLGDDKIVTKDLLVAGVHFLNSDPLDAIAQKSLRVNLSDLAAKGAKPIGYLLGCVWPAKTKVSEVEQFVRGLKDDQAFFKVRLLGGDTTAHNAAGAPLTISVTMIGMPPKDGPIRRSTAGPGDDIYVSGTIGDAAIGLKLAGAKDGLAKLDDKARDFLIDRYRLPVPRLALGGALKGVASASIDVSDGLLADAGHIAMASGVRLNIDLEGLPLSAAADAWLSLQRQKTASRIKLATGGDDYEILFTAPKTRRRAVDMASQVTKTPITRIGNVAKGEGAYLMDRDGDEIDVPQRGFDHFR